VNLAGIAFDLRQLVEDLAQLRAQQVDLDAGLVEQMSDSTALLVEQREVPRRPRQSEEPRDQAVCHVVVDVGEPLDVARRIDVETDDVRRMRRGAHHADGAAVRIDRRHRQHLTSRCHWLDVTRHRGQVEIARPFVLGFVPLFFPLTGFIPHGIFPGYTEAQGDPFNPGQAKQLLAQAGFRNAAGAYDPSTFPAAEVDINYNTNDSNRQVAEFIQAQWKQHLGITIALKNSELVTQLQSAATTDELTGLYNRRALEERLGAEISRSLRHQLRTTVILVDLDRFKNVNDTLGHAAGDRLLIEVAAVLRRECRTLDVCGRLGGDEFLVILPMTRPDEAMVFVSRVQAGFERLEQLHPEFGACSASFGLAECPEHGTTVHSVMAASDAALYRAKRGGRNAVTVALLEG